MKDEENEPTELTMELVPKAVNYLINEIAEMRAKLEYMEEQLGLGVNRHRPIDIEKAAEFLGMSKRQVRALVKQCWIPHYVKGSKVYFFEDELIEWIERGKVEQDRYSRIMNY